MTALPRGEFVPQSRFPVLLVALMFGLASGLVEGVLYNVFQHTRWLSWDEAIGSVGLEQIWISAIINLILFEVIALPLALAQRMFPWKKWPAIVIGLCATLTFYDWIHLAGRVHKLGSFGLALGLAYQTTRWLLHDQEKTGRLARKLMPALAALTLIVAGGVYAERQVLEKSREAKLPPAGKDAPSVLLLVMDAERADHISAYGYARNTTPNLDALAQRGVLFERAYSTSSWTLPSHASIMTGLWPYQHRATGRGDWKPLDGSEPLLADYLASKGYVTGGFVSNSLWAAPRTGLDHAFLHYVCLYTSVADMFARSFYGRVARRSILSKLNLPTDRPRAMAPELNQLFLNWVDQRNDRPFFAFLNYMEVHDGAVSVRYYKDRPVPKPAMIASSTQLPANMTEEYDYALACMDAEIARLLDELRKRGRLENTLVIVTSDHGELLGEIGLTGHGNALHHRLVHVPLILWNPKFVPEGVRVKAPVSQTELASTILDTIGEATRFLPGSSWRALWSGNSVPATEHPILAELDGAQLSTIPENWPIRKGWVKSIIQDQWQFLLREDGEVQLYDVVQDPGAANNLAASKDGGVVADRLRARLEELIPEARSVRRSTQTSSR